MQEITSEELSLLLKTPSEKFCLLDVREELEFHTYNIGGKNIPLGKLPAVIEDEDLPFDSQDNIILICQRGLRSKTAQVILQQNGYSNTRNLVGGLLKLQRLLA